ncbi:unnamed protein product, partial [Mesorhabditis belari]|uniref:ATP-binding cassette sub-family B member 6, mitochondrial n=1 Tax=Mesorhabditis belari TaxID=2138241 RepID=A0AAF3EA64_9BILA
MVDFNVCPDGIWPPRPQCAHVFTFGIYTALTLVNIIASCLPQRINYSRLDTPLSFSFYLSAIVKVILICVAVSYGFFVFFIHAYTHLLAAYCVSKIIFWLICLGSYVKWRNMPYLPISLAISYSIATVLQAIPLFNWAEYFPEHSFKNGEFVFYVVEASSTLTLFTLTMMIGTIKTETPSTWSNFSRKISMIAPYVWPKKSLSLQLRVGFCMFLLLFGRLINVALPLFSKWIVDALGENNFPYKLILISTGLKFLQGNGAMGGFLNTMRTYLWIPIQQYTTREMEVELFEHLHSLSLRWHLERQTGLVLRVMDRGTQSINSILNYVLFNIVPTLADIAIAVVFFFSTFNFYFGIIVLITMVAYLALTIIITEWRTKFRREMNEKENNWSAIGTDSLLNYETVKYYGNEQYEADRFRKAIQAYQDAEWRSNASLAFLNFTQNSIIGLGLVAGSLLVAYLISVDRRLTVGDYVLFTTYILQLYSPLNFFGTVYRTIQRSFIDMENMFDLMRQDVEVSDLPNAIEYIPSDGRITVKDLFFEYTPGTSVLKNISFEVQSGETIALVGESGSGKSTMIRLLFRLFEVCAGDIHFDGHDIKTLKMRSLRKQIGIVPQDTVLFNDTIKYNIRFGDPTASDAEVEEAAKAAMIHDRIMALPNRYDTVVGERGLKLSGGEKQRVAIARTILKKPQFIFLDEATSALDTPTERAIQKCLESLCVSRTSVVVAHRLSTIVNANQILVLHKGVVAEHGTHTELLIQNGLYARMWESQSQREGNDSSHSLESQAQ